MRTLVFFPRTSWRSLTQPSQPWRRLAAGRASDEWKLTKYANFNQITCSYIRERKIMTEPEVVALIKSEPHHDEAIVAAVDNLRRLSAA
jgi:hypothetical protein